MRWAGDIPTAEECGTAIFRVRQSKTSGCAGNCGCTI